MEFDPEILAFCALFLASKIEDEILPIQDVVEVMMMKRVVLQSNRCLFLSQPIVKNCLVRFNLCPHVDNPCLSDLQCARSQRSLSCCDNHRNSRHAQFSSLQYTPFSYPIAISESKGCRQCYCDHLQRQF